MENVDPEVARHKRALDTLRLALEYIRDGREDTLEGARSRASIALLLAADEAGNESFYKQAHAWALASGYRDGYIAALRKVRKYIGGCYRRNVAFQIDHLKAPEYMRLSTKYAMLAQEAHLIVLDRWLEWRLKRRPILRKRRAPVSR